MVKNYRNRNTLCLQAMRITFLISISHLFILTAIASGMARAQDISLDLRQTPVKKVFAAIEKQAGVSFTYSESTLSKIPAVDILVDKKPLAEVLAQLEKELPLQFRQIGRTIAVSRKRNRQSSSLTLQNDNQSTSENQHPFLLDVSGTVEGEDGALLAGASVRIKGTNAVTATNQNGYFILRGAPEQATLIISYIGYETSIVTATAERMNIILTKGTSKLDEVQVIAYGTTTQRLNTGSVGKVTAAEIERQPVSNPLGALQGRVPGLTVVQGNGVPGGSFKVQIRGQNSLGISTSEPLFIIDGVPFAPNNTNVNTLTSVFTQQTDQGISPLNSINPNDIESIEVLKDADATAIYGSRGANGVILITTNKGKVGKTRFTASVTTGVSTLTRSIKWMNTGQYIAMRKEALANDGTTATNINAPDLLVFDQSSYTNVADLLVSRNPATTDAQATLSGGNAGTQFSLSGSYRREGTPYTGDLNSNRGAVHFNISHTGADGRLKAIFTTNYTSSKSNLISSNIATGAIRLAPNTPELTDANGNLVWDYQGVSIENPLAVFLKGYDYTADNLLSNLNLSFTPLQGLTFRSSFGYNTFTIAEFNGNPSISNNPAYNVLPYSYFGDNKFNSWIIEPQAEYTTTGKLGKLNILAGGTWQSSRNNSATLFAYGYANDALLNSRTGATMYTPTSTDNNYRYQAAFLRMNYNIQDRYILNLTGRRDGSSRFGPDRRFSNFGAVGAAVLFSGYEFIKKAMPFLSFGKLRGSYGITGNDQITNYQYLDSWQSTSFAYQGTSGLVPSRLFNADYSWEENRKLEGALELGFLKDRILFSSAYFRNRSGNQLINYNLPSQTGFTQITRNFPALVQNSGWEFSLVTRNIEKAGFRWSTSLNISLPQNKLVRFDGIENTSYNSIYTVGQSLSRKRGFNYLGVDSQTGIYQFQDIDANGVFNAGDYVLFGDMDPDYYGGISNSLSYKGFSLDVFFEFKKQLGLNGLSNVYGIAPGTAFNLPEFMEERWRSPGDQSNIQKVSALSSLAANMAATRFTQSNGVYGDASYLRLKNVHFSYALPEKISQKLRMSNALIYVQGQNLLTITGLKYTDPETQQLVVLPPLRTFVFGLKVSL